jgi:hypothetical protein
MMAPRVRLRSGLSGLSISTNSWSEVSGVNVSIFWAVVELKKYEVVEAGAVVEREASVLEGKRLALVLHGQDENMRGSLVCP